jgi:hypothetical protein
MVSGAFTQALPPKGITCFNGVACELVPCASEMVAVKTLSKKERQQKVVFFIFGYQ